MKTYLTISELVKRLNISPSQYKTFRAWCYKNKDKLDTQDCKWNHGYYTYNVKLVSELYPKLKKHPATSPVEAAEMLGNALSAVTGRNVTGSDVLAAYERGKDYIRMRRTMARTLLRMREERRACKRQVKWCNWYATMGRNYQNQCDDIYADCRKIDLRELVAARCAFVTSILFIITGITFLTYIFCQ